MKRTASLILTLLIVLLSASAFSCSPPAASEEEVKTAARKLIEKSVTVNEIYFGKGLPYDTTGTSVDYLAAAIGVSVEDLSYYPMSEDSEYKTISEIKDLAASVYSSDYCEFLFERTFEGISSGDSVALYPRYLDQYDLLTVRADGGGMIIEKIRTFDLDSIEVIKIKSKYALVRVPAFVDGESDGYADLKLVYELIENIMCWRLDTPTY